MVHSAEFFVILNEYEDEEVIKLVEDKEVYRKESMTIVVRKTKIGNRKITRLHLFVDFILLLQKSDINLDDIAEIMNRLDIEVMSLLNREYKLILSRLDYRYDIRIENEDERKLIIKLLKKGIKKSSYMKKITKYKTTVRYFSKSRCDNIYDKEIERLAKGKEVKKYEKGIFRFEAQIKNEHLKYRNKKQGIDRSFEKYFTYEMYKYYMDTMIIKVVGKGDFYCLREAEKIIEIADIKDKYKKELREFLIYTSIKRCLSKTKDKYGRYKYKKYINILEGLGINPIIIPEKWRVKKIENPLRELINIVDE